MNDVMMVRRAVSLNNHRCHAVAAPSLTATALPP
jgi:hypothetical protein